MRYEPLMCVSVVVVLCACITLQAALLLYGDHFALRRAGARGTPEGRSATGADLFEGSSGSCCAKFRMHSQIAGQVGVACRCSMSVLHVESR